MGRLDGRVAIVTGAAQGIGAGVARAFAREGAAIAAIDQKGEAVEQVCADLRTSGADARAFAFDITDHDAYARSVEQIDRTHGHIDILVSNAAIAIYADLFESTLEQWRRTQAVNLEAVYWGAKLAAPGMARRHWGRIINISSVQSMETEPRVGAYAAAKGGINSLTRSLAVELAPHGILVNAIAPGCIHTPMSVVDGVDETTTEVFRTWYVGMRKIPLARAGEPEEVARVAVFLASEDASYVTGHVLVVDGGLSITL
jgi:NAD(P)-dependent dehydrogenase (short-subunit alcohol dehydrogenase family)